MIFLFFGPEYLIMVGSGLELHSTSGLRSRGCRPIGARWNAHPESREVSRASEEGGRAPPGGAIGGLGVGYCEWWWWYEDILYLWLGCGLIMSAMRHFTALSFCLTD